MIRTNNSTNKQNFSKPIPSIFSIFSRLVGGHFRFLFSLIKHRLYTHNAASFSLFFFQRITQSSTDFVLKKKTLKKIRRRGGIVIFLITKKKRKAATHNARHATCTFQANKKRNNQPFTNFVSNSAFTHTHKKNKQLASGQKESPSRTRRQNKTHVKSFPIFSFFFSSNASKKWRRPNKASRGVKKKEKKRNLTYQI